VSKVAFENDAIAGFAFFQQGEGFIDLAHRHFLNDRGNLMTGAKQRTRLGEVERVRQRDGPFSFGAGAFCEAAVATDNRYSSFKSFTWQQSAVDAVAKGGFR